MESNNIEKDKSKNFELNKLNINLENIKSDYFLRKIYDNMNKKKSLEIVKYNKKIQNRLNIKIRDYKEYSETFTSIEIEIIPSKNIYGRFIYIGDYEDIYYHIYFNDNEEEIKNKYSIKEEDKVTKIKIIIDYQIKSFEFLFSCCECIESINFKKFYRNNIINMNSMFERCSSLKELNLSNLNTSNVTDMSEMFYECRSF